MERLTIRCNGCPALARGYKERFTESSLFFMLLNRLTEYEDTGLTPEEIMALIAPPDAPLTMEELREMDGEPVWITPGGFWALVIARRGERVRLINHEGEIVWADKEIELVGPVYRHRPKGE